MASAEQYAKWIVDNQDKKGTPEFETVAQAYKVARGATQQEAPAAEPEKPTGYGGRMAQAAARMAKGFAAGGPLGVALAGVNEATGITNDLAAEGAYKAGGRVTDLATSAGASPEVAAGAGYVTNVAMQAAPALLAGKLTGMASRPAAEAGAKSLMRSALKPVLADARTGKAARAIDTLLNEGVNVTPGGLRVLRDKVDDLNRQIADQIRSSTATVDKQAVYGPVKEALDKFRMQVNPNSDINAIKGAWDEFVNHPMISGDNIPVQLAQKLKQGTYKALGNKSYGELKGAEIEAQKAIARGLKDEVAKAVPGVDKLNARESELLNALNVAERRVLVSLNKNPGGLAWLSSNPKAAAAFMADKSELFKSLLARMLNAGGERIPQAIVTPIVASVQSAEGGQ